jgi:lactoylglutathione lyase
MHIDHIAIWTTDLDQFELFYAKYFGASVAPRYTNPAKDFLSSFLSFAGGTRIEVMKTTTLSPLAIESGAQRMGLTHFAISVGTDSAVDQLTELLKADGHPVLDGPRHTGDGYYESVVLDPDGNRIEITA